MTVQKRAIKKAAPTKRLRKDPVDVQPNMDEEESARTQVGPSLVGRTFTPVETFQPAEELQLIKNDGPIGICPSVPGWKVQVQMGDETRELPIMLWVMYADGTIKPGYMQEGRGVVHDGDIVGYLDAGNRRYPMK